MALGAPLEHPIFRGVEPSVLAEIAQAAIRRTYQAGARVLSEDDSDTRFFILDRGSVKVVYRSLEGEEVTVKLFRAPAVFGEMECLSDVPYLESVEALETSEALVLEREVFTKLLTQSHRLTLNLLRDLAARLCIAAQNERSLAFHPIETRLANLLATYVDMYGLPVADGVKIRIRLTQDDLANALAVNRRSVTRTLKQWAADAIVVKREGHYVVTDPEQLERITDPTLLRIGHAMDRALR